jgi:hypothetical protein
MHRIGEISLIAVSAGVPASTAIFPGMVMLPAILGTAAVLITGIRSVFHWGENYLRFSQAREEVEGERRLYQVKAEPYANDDTRDQVLAAAITRIERDEMGRWVSVSAKAQESRGSDSKVTP